MNANSILNDEMTLEEKLQAISDAMEQAQSTANEAAARRGEVAAPLDPADLTMCEGCQ
jgi:TPP-dependent indolepyruvate ferredoxin oxidoreductase alpha subunit